jgi:tetratricopeptide (TPR) repeat protein
MLYAGATVHAFRHELARRSIEGTLAPGHARALHARVLAALSARNDAAPPAQLVHHAVQAGDAAAILAHAPRAAQQAAALSAHREAAAHYATALAVADALAPAARAALFEGRAYECYLTSRIDDAIAARESALALWRETGRRDKEGETLRWLSRLAWFAGRRDEPMRHAIEAIGVLESLPPGPELAMAYSNRAQLHMSRKRRPRRSHGAPGRSHWPSASAPSRSSRTR